MYNNRGSSLTIRVGRDRDDCSGLLRVGRFGRYGYTYRRPSYSRSGSCNFYTDRYYLAAFRYYPDYYDPGCYSSYYSNPYYGVTSWTSPGTTVYHGWRTPTHRSYDYGTVYTGNTFYVDSSDAYEPTGGTGGSAQYTGTIYNGGGDGTVEIFDSSGTSRTGQPVSVNGMVSGDPLPSDRMSFARQGSEAFYMGRYDEARRLYIRAVLSDDRNGVTVLLYAFANFATGDYEVASDALRRAIALDPSLIESPVDVRSLYGSSDSFESDLDELVHYLQIRLHDRDALFLLAYLYYCTEQPEESLPIFTHMVEEDANDVLASLLRDAALIVMQPVETVEAAPLP